MIVLGLILLAVAVALIVVAVISGGDSVTVSAFDVDLDTPLWGVFAAGVGTGLLTLLGILAVVGGVSRSRARREEIEYLRQKVAQHERSTGNEPTDQDVGGWLGEAHGRNRADTAADPRHGQEPRSGPSTSGAAPLYRTP